MQEPDYVVLFPGSRVGPAPLAAAPSVLARLMALLSLVSLLMCLKTMLML